MLSNIIYRFWNPSRITLISDSLNFTATKIKGLPQLKIRPFGFAILMPPIWDIR